MDIGIFAKTFAQPSIEAVLDAVHKHGLTVVQFNMSCAGLSSLPDFIDSAIIKKSTMKAIREIFISPLFPEHLI